jgi:hypothetical protein
MKTALGLISGERMRQIEVEGFTEQHDDTHVKGELGQAAACYSIMAALQVEHGHLPPCFIPKQWPFHRSYWKPSPDPLRNLAIAGALVAAEIDRLHRLHSRHG